ncbi:MAG: DEAD/DEAH box helicase [Deltaproteobacteria bacterium]|nr:DEAD/DEAH box helicase [Deltaproteobacteria bacterium]
MSLSFEAFGLHDSLLRGVREAGFEAPRPIQAETIPASLEGRDVLGLAQTGTGKTAAFALPLMHRLLEGGRKTTHGPRATIIAPTRELATQIAAEMKTLSAFTPLSVITIYGGFSMKRQINALARRPDIVVGCPGRMLDLVGQGVLKLDRIETLVLDEADHMFDMGFLPDIRKLMMPMPDRRQNLLFSATMPKEIRHLADDLLRDPEVVELNRSAPAETVDHGLYLIAEDHKRDLLEHLLDAPGCESAIVFTRTKHRARRLAQQLDRAGHRAVGLQGNMSQGQRDRAMRGFREGEFDVLVATDIVARGIDVSGVSHVINYDVPNTPEAYTHRIGRTGRAELSGEASTFVTGVDHGWLRATEKMIGEKIPRRRAEGFEEEAESRDVKKSGGGRGGRPTGRPGARRGQGSGGRSPKAAGRPGQRRSGGGGGGAGGSRRRRRRKPGAASA